MMVGRWAHGCAFLLLLSLYAPPSSAGWPASPAGLYDPVPEIGLPPPAPSHSAHHAPPPMRGALLVDCSGTHHGMFRSISAAAARAMPGGTILILPPGQGGGTCVETVRIAKPLTLASFGGGRDAVIQAPPDRPCLIAIIPLGDTLTVDGIRFIARNPRKPCVEIQAGEVAVRSSEIDSRSSAWAFDVGETGALTMKDSHIVTDGSGIRAMRAKLNISAVDIDLEGGRDGVGLWLSRGEGLIEGGTIIGGAIAIRASSGNHDVRLSGVKIRKAVTGVGIEAGGLGTVFVNRLTIEAPRVGIAIAQGTDADVTDNTITDVGTAGIAAPSHGKHRIDGNTITALGAGECVVGRSRGANLCHLDRPPAKPEPNLFERILQFVFGGGHGTAR